MKSWWVALGIIGVIVILLVCTGGSYITARNTMVQKNEDVDRAYSQVGIQLQRRLDLIPNLVASVKGYVKEESDVLTNIANARAAVIAAGSDKSASIQANTHLSTVIPQLYKLQEAYPNLKADQQFIRLTDELSGTENRIGVERQRYNKTLEDYNVFIKQFPNSIWANMSGFHYRDEYFKSDPAAATAPKVDFSK